MVDCCMGFRPCNNFYKDMDCQKREGLQIRKLVRHHADYYLANYYLHAYTAWKYVFSQLIKLATQHKTPAQTTRKATSVQIPPPYFLTPAGLAIALSYIPSYSIVKALTPIGPTIISPLSIAYLLDIIVALCLLSHVPLAA